MKRTWWSILAVTLLVGISACSSGSSEDDDDDATSDGTIAGAVVGTYSGSGTLGGSASTSYEITVEKVSDARIKVGGDTTEFEADLMQDGSSITSLPGASVTIEFDTGASPVTFDFTSGTDTFSGTRQ